MQEIIGLQAQQTILPDGTPVHYYLGGPQDGRPVVLLHGGGTDNAMLSWRDLIPTLLGAGFRIYAPDYPGYGDSPPDSKPATLDNLIGYLEGLLDAWNLDQTALVGISMGAALAIGTALKHPDRVSRLGLIASYGIQDRVIFHRGSYFLLKLPWLNDMFWSLLRRSRWAARSSLTAILRNPRSRTNALVDEVFEAMQNRNAERAFGQFQQDEVLWSGMRTNYTARLSQIQVPVLMVHGTQDAVVPVKYARRAAAQLQNGRLELIDHAGHWTQRDDVERVNRLVLDFLTG